MSFACFRCSLVRPGSIRIQSPRKNWNHFWSRRNVRRHRFHEFSRIMRSAKFENKRASSIHPRTPNTEESVGQLQSLAMPAMVGRVTPCAPGHHKNLRDSSRLEKATVHLRAQNFFRGEVGEPVREQGEGENRAGKVGKGKMGKPHPGIQLFWECWKIWAFSVSRRGSRRMRGNLLKTTHKAQS